MKKQTVSLSVSVGAQGADSTIKTKSEKQRGEKKEKGKSKEEKRRSADGKKATENHAQDSANQIARPIESRSVPHTPVSERSAQSVSVDAVSPEMSVQSIVGQNLRVSRGE